MLYQESNILDIRQLFYININITQYINKNELLTFTHKYKTRQQKKYKKPLMHKSVGQRCYKYLGPKLFNTLPDEIKNERTLHSFKRKIKINVNGFTRKEIQDLIEL